MRRTVVIVPGLLSALGADSVLRQKLPSLAALTELGHLSKISSIPRSTTPEAMLLGFDPRAVHLHQGPLTVSALGFDPPERSTHFHLSLMSFHDGVITHPNVLPKPEDLVKIMEAAKRLDTRLLTVLKGEELEHALVWEALGEMRTHRASEVDGKTLSDVLPEGDGDVGLRRFIDDSVNLLSSLELNERRMDEGLPAFNLLWPWGQGIRYPVPNLALKRGEPAVVESSSMRLAGLTRLAGYKHGDRQAVLRGLKMKLRGMADRASLRQLSILYVDVPMELRVQHKHEELDWFVRELDRELFEPILLDHLKTPSRVAVFAPGALDGRVSASLPMSDIGIGITVETAKPSSNVYPFDERSLEERGIPTRDLWTLVDSALG